MRSIVKRMFGLRSRKSLGWQSGAQVVLYGTFEPSKAHVSSIYGYDAYSLTHQAMGMLGYTYNETSEACLAVEEGEEDWSSHASGMTTFIQMGWGIGGCHR